MAYDRVKYRLWDSEVEILRLHGRVISGDGSPDPTDVNQFTPFMTWAQTGADGNYIGTFQNPVINVIHFAPEMWGIGALFHTKVKGANDSVSPAVVVRSMHIEVFNAAGVLANIPSNMGFAYVADIVQASGSNNRFAIMDVPP